MSDSNIGIDVTDLHSILEKSSCREVSQLIVRGDRLTLSTSDHSLNLLRNAGVGQVIELEIWFDGGAGNSLDNLEISHFHFTDAAGRSVTRTPIPERYQ